MSPLEFLLVFLLGFFTPAIAYCALMAFEASMRIAEIISKKVTRDIS